MTMPTTLEPELAELLDRIGRDPRAKLFVTAPRQLALALRGSMAEARTSQAGLTADERHLLAKYRDQLGELLLEGAICGLQRDPNGALCMRRVYENPRTPQELAQSLDLLRSTDRDLEHALAVPLAIDFTDTVKLAVLATRIRNTPRAQITLGMVDCNVLGEITAAKRVFFRLIGSEIDSEVASCALCDLGLCYDLQSDLEEARRGYRAAARRALRASPLVSWLVTSLSMGDATDATEPCRIAGDLVDREIAGALSRALERARARRFPTKTVLSMVRFLPDGRIREVLEDGLAKTS